MRATIVYTTARVQPRLDWLLDGLERDGRASDRLELVVVDARGRSAQEIGYRPVAPVARIVETAPKPCVWQGPQRVTSRDWWALSNARNTGAVLATTDYLVFLDDRCHIGPRWLAEVRAAEAVRVSVVAGSYEKHEDLKVTHDHRRTQRPRGLEDCGGSWLFSCNFALPLEWFLGVNGFEEGCDGLSGEDSVLGLMLANRGHRIDFRPQMMVIQERSTSTQHYFARTDKGVSPNDKSHAAIARFGGRTRTELTPDLRALRARVAAGGGFPDVDRSVEHRDWYDGQPIREMTTW